jgi:hypothetical protein
MEATQGYISAKKGIGKLTVRIFRMIIGFCRNPAPGGRGISIAQATALQFHTIDMLL